MIDFHFDVEVNVNRESEWPWVNSYMTLFQVLVGRWVQSTTFLGFFSSHAILVFLGLFESCYI